MSDLTRLEATIRRGQQAFLESARAFFEIDERMLWKSDYGSLAEYAADRLDFSPSEVTRYRNAGLVLQNLARFDVLPANEGQCRELARIRPKQDQVKVWKAVVKSGERITAKLIAETAERLLDMTQPETQAPIVEEFTAVHEVVKAVHLLQAAMDGIETLDAEGRQSLLEQVALAEQQIEQLRACLLEEAGAVAA